MFCFSIFEYICMYVCMYVCEIFENYIFKLLLFLFSIHRSKNKKKINDICVIFHNNNEALTFCAAGP